MKLNVKERKKIEETLQYLLSKKRIKIKNKKIRWPHGQKNQKTST
jgi:hypothetical protein